MLFGQEELITKLAEEVARQVQNQPSVAGSFAYITIVGGALLSIGFGVLLFRLLKYMRETYEQCNETIKGVSKNLTEAFASELANERIAFTTELAAERADNRKTIDQAAKIVHDVRQTAFEAVSAKELAKKLQQLKDQQQG
jgi:hypothetical protein